MTERLILMGLGGVLVGAGAEDVAAAARGQVLRDLRGTPHGDDTASDPDSTDTAVLRRALGSTGAEPVERAHTALIKAMAERRDELVSVGRTLGSAEVLTRLRARGLASLTLLTGWLAENAALAVTAVGVDRYLDLEIGGYGDDAVDRANLIGVALARTEAKSGPHEATLLTNRAVDARAAVAAGARVVGLGPDVDALRAAGAAVVLPDLTDVDAVVAGLLG